MKNVIFIITILIFLSYSKQVNAASFSSEGIYYDILSYEDLTCEIAANQKYSGSGLVSIPDIVEYNGNGYTVIGIANQAFGSIFYQGGNNTLQVIDLSKCKHLTYIGLCAFSYAIQLRNIVFPESLERIGNGAFSHTALTEVDLSGCPALEIIEPTAFDNCASLQKINLSGCSQLTTIGEDVCRMCYSLDTLILDQCTSLASIGNGAFLQNPIKTLDFSDCRSLKEIAYNAFWGCKSLKSVNFEGCTELNFIENNAFGNCTSLIDVNFTGCYSLAEFDKEVFSGCTAIKEIDLSKTSLSVLGSRAFVGCQSLGRVILPETLSTIGYQAFYECEALNKVTCYATQPPSITTSSDGKYSGLFTPPFTYYGTLYVRAESLDLYKSAKYWASVYTILPINDDKGGIKLIYSDTTTPQLIVYPDGVRLSEAFGEDIAICDLSGRTIWSTEYYNGELIHIESGIWIIKIGKKCSFKVVYQD